jgi:hypothetical protein
MPRPPTDAEKDELEERLVAHHEAGHAVAAAVLGCRFKYVVMWDEGGGELRPSGWYWSDYPAHVVWLDRLTVATMAGGWAEILAMPERYQHDAHFLEWVNESSRLDFEAAAHDAIAAGYKVHEIEALLDRSGAEARQLISDNWFAVEAVAQALRERRGLREEEVLRIVAEVLGPQAVNTGE